MQIKPEDMSAQEQVQFAASFSASANAGSLLQQTTHGAEASASPLHTHQLEQELHSQAQVVEQLVQRHNTMKGLFTLPTLPGLTRAHLVG